MLRLTTLSVFQIIQRRMTSEKGLREYAEESERGLIGVTILTFSWKD
jgi:hypothetical protein